MPDETVTTTEAAPATETAPTETTTTSTPENLAGNDWFNALDTAFEKLEKGEKAAAEPPAEEKKEDPAEPDKKDTPAETTDDDDPAVKNMTPTAGAKFKEIKAEAKAARAEAAAAKTRLAELEAKLAEVEKAPKPDAEESASLKEAIAAKEARLAELEKVVAVKDFESTQEYQETVVTPMAAILSVVERMAKKYEQFGISEKKLIAILEESDYDAQGEQIAEVAANFAERDRVSLYTLGDDYRAVIADREALREKAAEGLKALEAAKQAEFAKRTEEAKKSWTGAVDRVWEKLQKSIPLPDDASEAAKLASDTKAQIAATDFGTLTDDQKAYAAYAGSQLPRIVKMVSEKDAKIAELNEALKKFQTAEPGAAAGASTTAPVDDDVDFLTAVERRFGA